MSEKKIEFKSFKEAMEHLKKIEEEGDKAIKLYRQNVADLTGYTPDHRVGPLEVVNIVNKVWGHRLND